MGQTSADAQREIEYLRDDLSATIAELERRARGLADLPRRAQRHPALVGVVATGALTGTAFLAYRAASSYRERQRPTHRLQQRAQRVAGGLGERLEYARAAFPYRLERRDRDSEESVESSPRKPGKLKSLLWMGLTAGLIALFGVLARRVSAAIWESVMHEAPPTRRV